MVGNTLGERLDSFIKDIILNSRGKNEIIMSPPCLEALLSLRKWMFDTIYTNTTAKSQEGKAEGIVCTLYSHFTENPEELPEEYRILIEVMNEDPRRIVSDYISSMTDRYAIGIYEELYIPDPWQKIR